MNKLVKVVLLSLFSITACTNITTIESNTSNEISNISNKESEFIVNFNKSIKSNQVNDFAKENNFKLVKFFSQTKTGVFSNLDTKEDIEANTLSNTRAKSRLKSGSIVDNLETSHKIKLSPIIKRKVSKSSFNTLSISNTNDPFRKEQTYLDFINISDASKNIKFTKKINVAVIDTGVDLNHVDLKGKILKGINIIDNKLSVQDDNGHGTHISGIIAANSNNREGISGICSSCYVLPIKVMGSEGYGEIKDVAEGIIWAVDNGANIINLSLGGGAENEFLKRAIDYAINKNISVVVAAGNEGKNGKIYPAVYDNVISVGSVSYKKLRSDFSNYGNNIDVVAPGEQIISTILNNEYDYKDGTSMAAPIVSALIGVALQKHNNYNPKYIKNKLEKTSIDLFKEHLDDADISMKKFYQAYPETLKEYYGNGLISPTEFIKQF